MQKIIVSKGYEKMAENKKLITADNSFLTYMGRIDFSDKRRHTFKYITEHTKSQLKQRSAESFSCSATIDIGQN